MTDSREEMFVDCDIKSIDASSVSTGDSARTEQLLMNEDIGSGVHIARVRYGNGDYTTTTRQWNTIEVGPVADGTPSKEHAIIGFKLLKSNHSYCPNTRIFLNYVEKHIDFYSISPIAKNESISWDYTTSEYEMDECFSDWESGKPCQGFKFLPEEDQKRMVVAGEVTPHVYSQYYKKKVLVKE